MIYLVSGDQHLRPDHPKCTIYTDDEWMVFQEECLQFVIDKGNEHNATIVYTGDMFDVPRVPPVLVNMLIKCVAFCKTPPYIIAGNHSLQYHRESNVEKSSIGVTKNNPLFNYLTPDEHIYGTRFEHSAWINENTLVIHTLSYPEDPPFGMDCPTAQELLDKYPDAKWIFIGDLHIPYHYEKDGRHVISSGKMTVQKVNEDEHDPIVYLVDTDKETVTSIPLPHNRDRITDAHIQESNNRQSRIASVVEVIRNGKRVVLSFIDGLYDMSAKLSLGAQNIIHEIEETKCGI